MKKEKKLLIIGPLPENHGIGGVTIHVQRLLDFLDKSGFAYKFMDYGKTPIKGLLGAIRKVSIVHFHISNPFFLFFLVITARMMGKNVIMTLHGNYGRFSTVKNFIVRVAVKIVTVPIIINQRSYDICKKFNERAVLIPAFIPPQITEELQSEIEAMLNKYRGEGRKIVSTNAYNITYDKKGLEIYGIDFLVRFFSGKKGYVLIVSDPSGNYKKKYPQSIDGVEFVNYPHPYFELLKHVDCFVRNTSTDGDALSVKEALYLKIPTLCTDVVDRPEGVCLFKYSDEDSFRHCLQNVKAPNYTIENGAERVLRLYEEI